MGHVLTDHGVKRQEPADSWQAVEALPAGTVALVVLGLETGFETPSLVLIGEQDILGDRLVRPRSKRRPTNFLS